MADEITRKISNSFMRSIDPKNELEENLSIKIQSHAEDYLRFLTRGGFIKDRNGKWCKDGIGFCTAEGLGQVNMKKSILVY